jgi:hypothetical protein
VRQNIGGVCGDGASIAISSSSTPSAPTPRVTANVQAPASPHEIFTGPTQSPSTVL